jgi:hypothetical protein
LLLINLSRSDLSSLVASLDRLLASEELRRGIGGMLSMSPWCLPISPFNLVETVEAADPAVRGRFSRALLMLPDLRDFEIVRSVGVGSGEGTR